MREGVIGEVGHVGWRGGGLENCVIDDGGTFYMHFTASGKATQFIWEIGINVL